MQKPECVARCRDLLRPPELWIALIGPQCRSPTPSLRENGKQAVWHDEKSQIPNRRAGKNPAHGSKLDQKHNLLFKRGRNCLLLQRAFSIQQAVTELHLFICGDMWVRYSLWWAYRQQDSSQLYGQWQFTACWDVCPRKKTKCYALERKIWQHSRWKINNNDTKPVQCITVMIISTEWYWRQMQKKRSVE